MPMPAMKKILIFTMLLVAMVSCTNEPYDTGDGTYSNMRVDFAEAYTNSSAYITSIYTDDGETLPLSSAVTTSWAETADSTYRVLVYYNKVETSSGTYQAEPLSMSMISTPNIYDTAMFGDSAMTDPVNFVSSWKSKNGKYLNLELSVLTGTVNGSTGQHVIGMMCDSVTEDAEGHRTVALTFYHDQNGVPEYYSTDLYVSIPITFLPITPAEGDTVKVTVNTYDGENTRTFSF